jgi:rubrerythrin
MSSSTGQGDMGQQGSASQSTASQSTASTMATQTAGDSSQNLRYDLISTIYHAHKSASSIQKYIQDATQAGNNEVAQFFQMVAQEDQQRAQRAQDLLGQLGGASGSATTH